MAQHDYVIANQGFPAFRSDLNNALAAIVSNNSSATEPTTMYAYQFWMDTTADPSILKVRNADNDAWITLGTFNQTADTFTPAGSTTDKIEEGDSKVEVVDTGTGKIEFVVDNVEVADFTTGELVFNETGANQDFRVEGDTNANLIVADAGVDKVGIGTNTFNTNGGVLQVSNGISFPATQSACADANTLDDYEEGTWTPVVAGATTAGSVTYTDRFGYYTKIGRLAYIYFDLNVTAFSGGAGNLVIQSVPFTNANLTANYSFYQPFAVSSAWGQTYTTPTGFMNPNTTVLQMFTCEDSHTNFAAMKVNEVGRISGYIIIITT